MRISFKDVFGYISCLEVSSMTAVTDAVGPDEYMEAHGITEEMIDSDDFEGIKGLHIMPVSQLEEELFIPTDDAENYVRLLELNGHVDLTKLDEAYSANEWSLY
ncbi:MAG: hypothetical protein NC548_10770 [Lachnospiraceae bacterium]|nr:hypothetical protein [Lachnospiraceae bacterium]